MYQTMKKQNFLVLLASLMLVAMNLASCKNSNKPAAAEARVDTVRGSVVVSSIA